jgi:CheY-like chemotaxis protein
MPQGNSRPLVLLVEDSEDLRETLEEFLASRGYRVVARAELLGAVEAMRAQRPDLVVTDIFLGNTSGLDLITSIRSDFPEPPPIIACSGMPEVERAALARGADVFLSKPLDPDTFGQAVAALLAARAPSRELLEESAKRSLVLRAHQLEAARSALARLEPDRAMLTRQGERDMRWLRAFLGFGTAIITMIDGDRLKVLASSDPQRWPEGRDVENELRVCRHVLETGSTFVVPDLGALLAQSGGVEVGPRFVAGFPVFNAGVPVGVVCLIEDRPRRLDSADFTLLETLSSHFSQVLAGEKRAVRESLLLRRSMLELVLGTEFDRAARLGLTVHLLAFASRTSPPDVTAERTLLVELGAGRFGMLVTRGSNDRAPPDLVAAVKRLAALPGFKGGDLLSVEVSAVPHLDQGNLLQLAERRLQEREVSGGPPRVDRVVIRREALAEAS